MKKVIMLCVVVSVILLPTCLINSSCESVAGAEYYINFTVDGAQYSCIFGLTDVGNGNPWAAVLPGDWTFIAGTNGELSTDDEVPPSGYVWIEVYINGTTADAYSYPAGEVDLLIEIYIGGEYSEYEANSGSLEITAYGDVGETVEGRFDMGLDLVYYEGGVVPLGTAHSTKGTFRVEHIEWTLPIFMKHSFAK